MVRSATTTSSRPWRAPPKRVRPGNGDAPRAASHLSHSRLPGVRVDLARPEYAPHAAHERDERHSRHHPGRRDHRARRWERRLHHYRRLCSGGLRGCERGRRLLGDQSDARHVPSTATKSKEEEGITLQVATFLAYLVAAALFILGIRRLRTPETARSGNTLAVVGMVIALVATFFVTDIATTLGWPLIGGGILVGGVIGAVSAQRVQMTAMPQLVAAFNGVGGGAAALVALSEFYQGRGEGDWVAGITVLFSVIIGSVSFAGSIIAFCKLQEIAFSGSVVFPLQQVVNALILLGIILLSANILSNGALAAAVGLAVLTPLVSLYIILGASLVLGVLFVIPIGGADMPIVISLLNAFTGLAAAASGFVLDNYALI